MTAAPAIWQPHDEVPEREVRFEAAGLAFTAASPAALTWTAREPAPGLPATMMIPREITLVPKFVLFSELGWVDTYLPLVVPEFFGVALFIFLLRQFFTTIPQELIDAARIDGASELRILWSIMSPLARPAIAAICLFSFVGNGNRYLENSIYLRSMEKITLAQGLGMFDGQYVTQYNQMMAVAIMSMVPILVVFFLAQKTFIRGVTLTGIAGR